MQNLPGGKTSVELNTNFVERGALALVHGQGPGELKRNLCAHARAHHVDLALKGFGPNNFLPLGLRKPDNRVLGLATALQSGQSGHQVSFTRRCQCPSLGGYSRQAARSKLVEVVLDRRDGSGLALEAANNTSTSIDQERACVRVALREHHLQA